MRRVVLSLASFFLPVFAPIGLGLFLVNRLLKPKLRTQAAWLWLSVVLLIPVPFQLANSVPWWLLAELVLIFFLGHVLKTERRPLLYGLSAALGLMLVMGLIDRQASKRLWVDSANPPSVLDSFSGISHLKSDTAKRQGRHWTVGKEWDLEGSSLVELSFDARLAQGQIGWDWYRYNPAYTLSRRDGELITKVIPAAGDFQSISREVYTGLPLAHRSFRAIVRLRAETTNTSAALILQENGANYRGQRQLINVTSSWQSFDIRWDAPESIEQKSIRLLISDVVVPFEVDGGYIEEFIDGHWQRLKAEPVGLVVRPIVDARRQDTPSKRFLPTEDWQSFSFSLDTPDISRLRLAMQIEGGLDIDLRNIKLNAQDGEALPLASRTALWFPQANLAGHTGLVVSYLIALLSPNIFFAMLSLGLGFVFIFLTASRAAWLTMIVASLVFLAITVKRRWLRLGLLVLLAAMSLAVLGRSLFSTNNVSRFEIWELAWIHMWSRPLFGIGEAQFSLAWQDAFPLDTRDVPPHAHNLWLEFGSSYGIPGFVAIIAMTAVLMYLAWRWGAWRGLALTGAVLCLNLFDFSFFYAGVLMPLILGLNLMREESLAAHARGDSAPPSL